MVYCPSIGEIVLIEPPHFDDPLKVRIVSLNKEVVWVERVDGLSLTNNIFSINDIVLTDDQTKLAALMQDIKRREAQAWASNVDDYEPDLDDYNDYDTDDDLVPDDER